MVNRKLHLKDVFNSISEPIRAVLSSSSRSIPHPGTKGDVSESQWIACLKTYLPKRYCVSKGFVIDYTGSISEQQDIIVYDSQFTPCLLDRGGVLYVPAESVYAVMEVKQTLSKAHIKYAGKKIASVRRLKRTSKNIIHAGGTYKPKPLHRILGGFVALKSDRTKLREADLKSALTSLTVLERIDIGCCLDKIAFVGNYDQKMKIEFNKKNILTFFLITFVSILQTIGTVPAIDFEQYLKTIMGEKR